MSISEVDRSEQVVLAIGFQNPNGVLLVEAASEVQGCGRRQLSSENLNLLECLGHFWVVQHFFASDFEASYSSSK